MVIVIISFWQFQVLSSLNFFFKLALSHGLMQLQLFFFCLTSSLWLYFADEIKKAYKKLALRCHPDKVRLFSSSPCEISFPYFSIPSWLQSLLILNVLLYRLFIIFSTRLFLRCLLHYNDSHTRFVLLLNFVLLYLQLQNGDFSDRKQFEDVCKAFESLLPGKKNVSTLENAC